MKKLPIVLFCLLAICKLQGQVFGINPIVNNQIKAFPQKVDDYLYVQLPKLLLDDSPKLEIHDAKGNLVATVRIFGAVSAVFMGDMPAGSYQLDVVWKKGSAHIPIYKRFADKTLAASF